MFSDVVCVCVFSLVTPQPHDYMAVWQPYCYIRYIGFVIHDGSQLNSQVGVLWGFMSGGGVHMSVVVFSWEGMCSEGLQSWSFLSVMW